MWSNVFVKRGWVDFNGESEIYFDFSIILEGDLKVKTDESPPIN